MICVVDFVSPYAMRECVSGDERSDISAPNTKRSRTCEAVQRKKEGQSEREREKKRDRWGERARSRKRERESESSL